MARTKQTARKSTGGKAPRMLQALEVVKRPGCRRFFFLSEGDDAAPAVAVVAPTAGGVNFVSSNNNNATIMAQQAAAAAVACTHGAIRHHIRHPWRRDILFINQNKDDTERADQQSVQYLVDHLHSDSVRELCLFDVRFSDEGFNVLLAYFASDTTSSLTKLSLFGCDLGPRPERASQLLAAIQTNNASLITDLTVIHPHYHGETLQNATLDSDVLTGLLEKSNPHLQKLCLIGFALLLEELGNGDVLQHAHGNIRHLTALNLSHCQIDDARPRVITDGLVGNTADGIVGNTTLDVLDISSNSITVNALLSNIATLLESTQLKELRCGSFTKLRLDSLETAQRFAAALSTNTFMTTLDMENVNVSSSVAGIIFQGLTHNTTLENLTIGRMDGIQLQDDLELMANELYKNTSLVSLPRLDLVRYPQCPAAIRQINFILARNISMKRVALLLQPLPRTGLMIPENNLIWRRAIFRLARDPSPSGATPIFYLLRSHPAILEAITRSAPLRQQEQSAVPPPPPVAVAAEPQPNHHYENEDNVDSDNSNDSDNN